MGYCAIVWVGPLVNGQREYSTTSCYSYQAKIYVISSTLLKAPRMKYTGTSVSCPFVIENLPLALPGTSYRSVSQIVRKWRIRIESLDLGCRGGFVFCWISEQAGTLGVHRYCVTMLSKVGLARPYVLDWQRRSVSRMVSERGETSTAGHWGYILLVWKARTANKYQWGFYYKIRIWISLSTRSSSRILSDVGRRLSASLCWLFLALTNCLTLGGS